MIEFRHQYDCPYNCEQLFLLVADVESYARFVPNCQAATVANPSSELLECGLPASLDGCLSFGSSLTNYHLCTRNTHQPFERIGLDLISGPCKSLSGGWNFKPRAGGGCLFGCELDIKLGNILLEKSLRGKLSQLFENMMQALLVEAARRYGG